MLEGDGEFEGDVGGKAEAGVMLGGLDDGILSDACFGFWMIAYIIIYNQGEETEPVKKRFCFFAKYLNQFHPTFSSVRSYPL